MSKPELAVVLSELEALIDDLRDLQMDAPQHVIVSSTSRIAAIKEAARELRRLHQL